jgi:hypothetical protein
VVVQIKPDRQDILAMNSRRNRLGVFCSRSGWNRLPISTKEDVMKPMNLLATIILITGAGLACEVQAAKVVYTTPIWTTPNIADGAARISCGAMNLDKKVQTVTAQILSATGAPLNDVTADIDPGATKDITFWNLGNVNGNLICRFTVNNNKVRAFATAYNQDFHTLFVLDAK